MTAEEIEHCLERFTMGKTTDVMNFDYAGTLKYICNLKKDIKEALNLIKEGRELISANNEAIDFLEKENAELRARLNKAVELKEPDIELNPYTGDWELRYQEVVTKVKVYDKRSEAEVEIVKLKAKK